MKLEASRSAWTRHAGPEVRPAAPGGGPRRAGVRARPRPSLMTPGSRGFTRAHHAWTWRLPDSKRRRCSFQPEMDFLRLGVKFSVEVLFLKGQGP